MGSLLYVRLVLLTKQQTHNTANNNWLINEQALKATYGKQRQLTSWRDPDAQSPFPQDTSCRMLFAWPCKPMCRNCNTKNESVICMS